VTFSIDAVDAHAEGQHGRVVVGGTGVLAAPGQTMLEKMKYLEQHADWFRRLMVREPRGYPRACVNVLLPPTDPRADAGFVIMEQSELYAAMSGTNLMVVTTVLLETGLIEPVEPVTTLALEAPAGVPVDVPGFGRVPVSVAWGGMACAVVDASSLGLELTPGGAREIQEAIIAVCAAARAELGFRHPLQDDLSEVEAVVVIGESHDERHDARQTCGLPGGQMDTSPSGTGASAAMAVLWARGNLAAGATFVTEGLLGGVFRCSVASETEVGGVSAIVPRIGGRAWITGYARYVLHDDDPFPEGFVVGDIWPLAVSGSDAERLTAQRRR
jgi:proline racemase